MEQYAISKHAQERYAERIMDKDTQGDIQRFIVQNQDRIIEDVHKMLEFGKIIYTGQEVSDKGREITVYLTGSWILLVDSKKMTVITLYKINLCIDEEFHKLYISKLMQKIESLEENYLLKLEEEQRQNKYYDEQIQSNNLQINEYRSFIKKLEETNIGYKEVIEGNKVQARIAKSKLADVVNELIGRKIV